MVAGQPQVCSVGFSVALLFLALIDGEGYRVCEEAGRGIRVRDMEFF